MSLVAFLGFLAAFLADAHAVTLIAKEHKEQTQIIVGSDAKQMMRNARYNAASHKVQNQKSTAAKTVEINLYYETRCPDCVMFINQTLEPLWRNKEMRPHLNITVNPYGNAMSIPVEQVSAGYKFWHPESTKDGWEYVHICQHGSDECLGNLIQTCAINIAEQEKYMELILCMADKPDWSIEKASYDCMQQHGIDHDKVKECVESPQGNKLFADYGKKTGDVPGRQGTPWVLINGEALGNVTDLMKTVCTHVMVEGSGPTSCQPFAVAPTAEAAPAPAPAEDGGDDDTFTVLPVLKKKEKALVALSRDKI
jgi:interferon gamma-inducible protein 30